ncbi:GntR family transcriptional regulator [Pseudonocardia sp. RS11V-5]|uniref:GntR family transcriptional regulator n=1 Tax=Pseudonocardia terrae TaxID=2905831 RepID=UPI001E3D43F2|nr:GntR family transcriptional regulator [Pseudonocardia terrae]MCE3554680.1 GntR family transcriptional regulator [Pseudonocardia terrae]
MEDTPVAFEVELDRASPVPLYHQLALAIERAIETGVLKPGDRLENEVALTARLGLARPTARQAIQELVTRGMLVRKRGVGTQVVQPHVHREVRLTSLFDDLAAEGRVPGTELLSLDECGAEEVPEPPGLPARLTRIRRLRSADGVRLALLTNYLPEHYSVSAPDLERTGLYALLRAQGASFRIAHQIIGARLMTADEATLLGEQEPAACVTVRRSVYDDTGAFVETGTHVYRASQYTVRTSLVV